MMEIRFQQHEMIEERGDKSTFTGLIRFWDGSPGTEYVLWNNHKGQARERLMPTAFDESLASNAEVWALRNHDFNQRLARRSKSTLELVKEPGGLRYRIPIQDHPLHELLAADIRMGNIEGSSFGFTVTKENWRRENGIDIRELHGVNLAEVSPVFDPAYKSSTIGLRSEGQIDEALISWKREETRKRLEFLASLTT